MKSKTSNPSACLSVCLGLALLGLCVSLAAAPPPPQPTAGYAFRTVDYPDKDFHNIFCLTWVNDSGLIVQQYCDVQGSIHTAILTDNKWTVIDVPGALNTGASNPNSQGQIALSYMTPDGDWHLAIWQRGRLTFVPDVSDYVLEGVQGINDRGQISAVVADPATGIWLGLVGTFPNYRVFAYPGSGVTTTIAYSTSSSGTTVGCYLDTAGYHPFLYDRKGFSTLDVNGGVNAFAWSINNEGDIAGQYFNSSGLLLGFLMVKGQLQEFNVPNALQSGPGLITDNHQIAGGYQAADGTWHGFVATPHPDHK